jgi:HTH-type transcriptional repressor of NAD biosynthesis genes
LGFVQDGLRDGEAIRTWMHGVFIERLRQAGQPFAVVSGSLEQSVETTVALIDDIETSVKF